MLTVLCASYVVARGVLTVLALRQAHPADGWVLRSAELKVEQPQVLEERLGIARTFVERNPMPWPLVVDTMDDLANLKYDAIPERLVVIEDGKVTFATARGPAGYKPERLQEFLQQRFPHVPPPSPSTRENLRRVGASSEDGAEIKSDVGDDLRRATAIVNESVLSNDVVVFSKSYCPFCKRVKLLLDTCGIQYMTVELDECVSTAAALVLRANKC